MSVVHGTLGYGGKFAMEDDGAGPEKSYTIEAFLAGRVFKWTGQVPRRESNTMTFDLPLQHLEAGRPVSESEAATIRESAA